MGSPMAPPHLVLGDLGLKVKVTQTLKAHEVLSRKVVDIGHMLLLYTNRVLCKGNTTASSNLTSRVKVMVT